MSFEKEEVLSVLGQDFTDGLKVGGVLDALGLTRREQGAMRRFLERLVKEGAVEKIARGTYAVATAASKGDASPRGPGAPVRPSCSFTAGPVAHPSCGPS